MTDTNNCRKEWNELVKEEKVSFLNADKIAKKHADKLGLRAGRILLNKFDSLLLTGESIVLESTIAGSYHNRIIARAKKEKYEIIFVYVFLDSVEQNLARIKQRVALGGHDVPECDVRRRYLRSMNNFWKTAEKVSHWELYYNGENSYEIIARGKADIVEIIDDVLYNKFKKEAKHDKKEL